MESKEKFKGELWKKVTNIYKQLANSKVFYLGSIKLAFRCWDTSNLGPVSNCDGVNLEIYLDHKSQWPQEGFNCQYVAYKVVT